LISPRTVKHQTGRSMHIIRHNNSSDNGMGRSCW